MVVQVVYFVTYLILARLAAPAVFGVFASGSILLAFGEIVTDSGMPTAVLQRRSNIDGAAATALVSTFLGGFALALLSLALSPLVGLYFHSREIGLVAAALSGDLIVNGVVGAPGAPLQRRFALRRWRLELFAMLVFGVGSGLGLAYGLGAWGLVIGWVASTIFRAAGFWVLVRWRPNLRLVSWTMWRDLAAYARHILVSILLGEVQRVSTTALVGRSLGPTDLGLFRFGWRLATQATAPLLVANAYTIQPALVRLAETPARARSAVLASFRIVALIAFPSGAVFIPLGSVIAVLMLGEQWRGVGPILTALAPMAMATAMAAVPSEIFKSTGRQRLLPRVNALSAVSVIVLTLAFVSFGAEGVAWAWSTSTMLVALFSLAHIPGATGVSRRELAAAIVPQLGAALAAAGALVVVDRLLFPGQPHADLATLGRLIVELVLGAAIYIALILVVARPAMREFMRAMAAIVARSPQPAPEDEPESD